ncbi:hypothetical protein Q1695_013008 [Nippostrongylus brasiliensis]|nr:hypothetical protein Q1695_013008 [Nippostrongylus brasiliensis]
MGQLLTSYLTKVTLWIFFDGLTKFEGTSENEKFQSSPSESYIVSPKSENSHTRTCFGCCCSVKQAFKVFKFAVEEWVFLALLGLIMAICSLVIDIVVSKLHEGHVSFYRHFRSDPIWAVSFGVWTFYTVVLTCASALCAHYIAPQAIGSGIPEMKTILRGVVLKEYLTVRTLISKMIALTLSLGSGLTVAPVGGNVSDVPIGGKTLR